jgi:broad specificity phosphatase PhoE
MTVPSPSAAAAAARRTRLLNGVAGSSSSPPSALKPIRPPKRLLLLRHGQAAHNPRAEVARESGCSFEEFLRLMEEDDEYDAALTRLGEDQAAEAGGKGHVRRALRDVDMIVSSPLSRALRTADLIFPHRAPPPPPTSASQLSPSPSEGANGTPRRVCVEEFREINGRLLNAKRRPRFELERIFPHWDFSLIPRESADVRPISTFLVVA